MKVTSVRDLGALARAARLAAGLTQAELATRLGVSRDWVVRLEQGHPRLEAQKVLDALAALDVTLDATQAPGPSAASAPTSRKRARRSAARVKSRVFTTKSASNGTPKGGAATIKRNASTGRYVVKHASHRVPSDSKDKGDSKATSSANPRDPFDELFRRR